MKVRKGNASEVVLSSKSRNVVYAVVVYWDVNTADFSFLPCENCSFLPFE